MNQVHSFTLNGWKRISYSKREREELAMHRIDKREKVLQKNRMRNFHEIEELRKLCCAEGESAKQLRIDDLSFQEKVNLQ